MGPGVRGCAGCECECQQGVGANGSVDADWSVVSNGSAYVIDRSDGGVGRRPVRCGGYARMWGAVSGVEVKVEATQRPKK